MRTFELGIFYKKSLLHHSRQVGEARMTRDKQHVAHVKIDREHRRNKIGTHLYDYIEQNLGHRIEPYHNQSAGGIKFWSDRLKKHKYT